MNKTILSLITIMNLLLINKVYGTCQDSSDCNNDLICIGNECSDNPLNTQCFNKLSKARKGGLLGAPIPKCDSNGDFLPVQCTGSKCYCVDREGNNIRNYAAHINEFANMDCKCAREQNDYFLTGLIGKMFSCTTNGSYSSVQCNGSVCFCADYNGKAVAGKPIVNIGQIQSLRCN